MKKISLLDTLEETEVSNSVKSLIETWQKKNNYEGDLLVMVCPVKEEEADIIFSTEYIDKVKRLDSFKENESEDEKVAVLIGTDNGISSGKDISENLRKEIIQLYN